VRQRAAPAIPRARRSLVGDAPLCGPRDVRERSPRPHAPPNASRQTVDTAPRRRFTSATCLLVVGAALAKDSTMMLTLAEKYLWGTFEGWQLLTITVSAVALIVLLIIRKKQSS